MSGFGPDGRVKRGSRLANAAIDGAGLASEPIGGSGAEAALPSLRLTIEPPRSGHLVGFWLPAIALMAIACIGAERWQQFFALLPASVRAALAPPGFVPNPLARFEAAFFLAGLALLLWRNRGLIADVLRTLQPQDGRHALYAIAVLELLSFVTRPSSLGLDYQLLSLGPFGQHTGVFNRRILDVALAYYLHLGGAFFILFHFLTVFGLLAMTRAYLRRLGAEPSFLVFVSIASSAFIIFNFQYPGYPDPLVLMLVLAAVLAEIDLEGLLFVIVLALLAHEALALALFLPLAPLVPRRVWPVLALPFAIYGLLWLTDFGFDVVAGWTAQVHYQGLSGPSAFLNRPWVVLFGLLAANKLLWVVIGGQLVFVARRWGAGAVARLAAPLSAMAAISILSYDSSRMGEVGFLTLLWAWSGWAARRPRHIVLAVAVANLLLPSVYVSPYFRRPFGVVWTPGLYSVYDGFAANTVATK